MPSWWPFGRKRRKNKKERKAARDSKLVHELPATEKNQPIELPATPPSAIQTSDKPPRLSLGEKEPFDPLPHTREPRSTDGDHPESAEGITALPTQIRDIQGSPHLRPANEPGKLPIFCRSGTAWSNELNLGLQHTPSVRSRRSITHEASSRRSNSTTKRSHDQHRESQIKALSSPIPIPKDSGGLFGRNSKRLRSLPTDGSMVSLPQAGSVRSANTAVSDNHYEVGSFDVFSARPRIRTSVHGPSVASPMSRSSAVSRNDSRNEPIEASPRKVLRESKTIDNLADSYDSATLRELMDRDRKRRDRKRKAQEDRARRRLESYFEGQEAAAAGPSTRKGRPRTPKQRDKSKRDGREENGLGLVGVESGAGESELRRASTEQPREQDPVKETQDLSQRSPFDDPESPVTTPFEEPVVDTAKAIRYSHTDMSPPSSPGQMIRPTSNISQVTDPKHSSPATTTASTAAEPERKTSEPSSRKGPFAGLFRKSTRQLGDQKQSKSNEETSFKNTSRESMSRQLPPAHLREQAVPPRARSGTPTRTMSKFREDLPEYRGTPVSPPDSRMQSPDVAEVAEEPTVAGLSERQREKMPEGSAVLGQRTRALSRGDSPSIGVLSQSLASVDSEGSWLSGKPAKRGSTQMNPAALEERPDTGTRSFENLGTTDEEYFRRHATGQKPTGAGGISAAIGGRTSPTRVGQKDGVERYGEVNRTPTLVHHQARAKSSEGLLRQLADDEDNSTTTSPIDNKRTSPQDIEGSSEGDESPMDAESPKMVALGHARSISRGSATLLDIPAPKSNRGSQISTQSQTAPGP